MEDLGEAALPETHKCLVFLALLGILAEHFYELGKAQKAHVDVLALLLLVPRCLGVGDALRTREIYQSEKAAGVAHISGHLDLQDHVGAARAVVHVRLGVLAAFLALEVDTHGILRV